MDASSYHFKSRIGCGAYGEVFKIQNPDLNSEAVAFKKISATTIGMASIMELYIMAALNHPYLNHADKIEIDKNGNVKILQRLAEGDASCVIKSLGSLDSITLKRWCWQLVTAVAYLHSLGIIHGDIKASNILVHTTPLSKKGNQWDGSYIQLTDFSLSLPVIDPDIGIKDNIAYTPTHRSLEIWQKMQWSFPADIWALGCTFYELAYGHSLFPIQNNNINDVEANILAQEEFAKWQILPDRHHTNVKQPMKDKKAPPPQIFKSCKISTKWSSEMFLFNKLLLSLLDIKPQNRLTVWEIINHPYFDGIRDHSELPPKEKLTYPIMKYIPKTMDFKPPHHLTTDTNAINLGVAVYEKCLKHNNSVSLENAVIIAHKIFYRTMPSTLKEVMPHDLLETEINICNMLNYQLLGDCL